MRLIKYQPNFYSNPWFELENLFDKSFERSHQTNLQESTIRLNVFSDEGNRYIEAELPGVNREDLSIEVESGTLRLEVHNKTEGFEGKYQRSLHIGDDVETDKISASLKNGILQITAPKKESALPRKIQIN